MQDSLQVTVKTNLLAELKDSRYLMHAGSSNMHPMRKRFMIVESKHNVPMR